MEEQRKRGGRGAGANRGVGDDVAGDDGVFGVAQDALVRAVGRGLEHVFSYGSLSRTVRLPVGVVADRVSAIYKVGVLEVTVPVAEPVESKKIAIDVQQA